MRAVAERRVRGVLALAQPRVAGFFRGEFFRREGRALVRAVAERLRRGFSARAEPVVLAGFEGDFRGISGGDDGFVAHGAMLRPARGKASAERVMDRQGWLENPPYRRHAAREDGMR